MVLPFWLRLPTIACIVIEPMLPRLRTLLLASATAFPSSAAMLLSASPADAQQPAALARCDSVFLAPAADSQWVEIGLLIFPFDTTNRISHEYTDHLALGIREFLEIPKPLSLTAYDTRTAKMPQPRSDGDFAALTLRSHYRVELHRDGHLTRPRVVGGTGDASFDDALIRAIQALDTSGLLPPPAAPAVTFTGDSLELRLVVTPNRVSMLPLGSEPPQEGITPILRYRTPIRHISKMYGVRPGNPAPRYPEDLRSARVQGDVLFEFIVEPDSTPRTSSIQILRTTVLQFATATLEVLPRLRFYPLEVEGCAVPVMVHMPFQFRLGH